MATEFFQFFWSLFPHWLGLDYVLNPHKRLFWGYLLASLLIGMVHLFIARLPWRQYFTKRIWWHSSARLDYVYFFVISIIKLGLILPWMLSISQVALLTLQGLESTLGYQLRIIIDRDWLIIAYTFSLFVLGDLSRYWLHRLMHQSSILWAFHQVHHSAAVLTPITFYRVHPIENLLFGLRYALSAGLVTGIFIYFLGAALAQADVLGINAFIFLAHAAGDNLRHSPIPLRYPRWLEFFLVSPAMHQYHHTRTGNCKNYGGVLALWDWFFGSLKKSRRNEKFEFGIEHPAIHDSAQFNSVYQLLFSPFKQIKLLFISHEKPH